jgi:hypothetical protein
VGGDGHTHHWQFYEDVQQTSAGALQPDGSILFEDSDQIAILVAIDAPAWMSL